MKSFFLNKSSVPVREGLLSARTYRTCTAGTPVTQATHIGGADCFDYEARGFTKRNNLPFCLLDRRENKGPTLQPLAQISRYYSCEQICLYQWLEEFEYRLWSWALNPCITKPA